MQGKLRILLSDQKEEYQNQNGGGGVSFQFPMIGASNRKLLRMIDLDPKYIHRCIYNGMSLEAICRNPSCSVKGEKVWINKGYGIFRINQEVIDSVCPICHELVPSETVKTLGYTEGNIKVEGKKQGEASRYQWIDKQTEGMLVKFDGFDGGETVTWNVLKVTVSQLS